MTVEQIEARCNRDREREPTRKKRDRSERKYAKRPGRHKKRYIIGIDGEGKDLPDGSHIYTLLCAVDETGRVVGEVENQNGLSSQECFKMLLELPRDTLKFIFMGSYDWTKIIEDLHQLDIYYIMHPESRRLRVCTKCKKTWHTKEKACPVCKDEKFRSVLQRRSVAKDKHGKQLNLKLDWFNGSFTVAHQKRSVKVWDCFKFFQSSFVKAIEAWKIGTKEQQERIAAMKKKRGEFAEEKPEDVRNYCREECFLLAQMMRKLISACEVADIELQRFDGAGAIANALCKKIKLRCISGRHLR